MPSLWVFCLLAAAYLHASAGACTSCADGAGNSVGTAAFPAASCGAVSLCGLADGVYWLAPAGTPYQAQCTGGWALAMKVDGAQQTFAYSSAYWTDGNLLNPSAVTGAGVGEAKLAPFLDLPGDSIQLVMTAPNGQTGSPVVVTPGAFDSLRALFIGGYVATTTTLASWRAMVPGSAPYEPNCNVQGINNVLSAGVFAGQYTWTNRWRIGLVMNNENDCLSPDTSYGIGGSVETNYSYQYCSGADNYFGLWPFTSGVWNAAGPSCGATVCGSFCFSVPGVFTVSVGTLLLPTPPVCSPTATPSFSPSMSSPSTPTSTLAPSCLPTAYTPYAYTDLSGTVLSVTLGAPSERDCQLECCATAGCTGYSWAGMLPNLACFQFANVTGVTPNVLLNSGLLILASPPPTPVATPSRSTPASVSVSPSVARSKGPARSSTGTAQQTPSCTPSATTIIPPPPSIRYVRVTQPALDCLNFAEFELFTSDGVNVALNKNSFDLWQSICVHVARSGGSFHACRQRDWR